MENQRILTMTDKANLLKELEELKIAKQEVTEEIKIARGFGDLSENAEYTEARNDQAKNEAEITRLKSIIDNAVVVSESEINTDSVSVGTTVKYLNVSTGKEAEYGIVGADEADPLKGLISNESPIGMALLGHKVGDVVEVEIPRGFLKLQILDIHR